MDADAVHLWLDELHGELCGGYEVHFVLPHVRERDRRLHDSLCHREPTAVHVPTSDQADHAKHLLIRRFS